MVKRPRIKKRCQICHWVGLARPRQTHCYQRRFGKGSYACWGALGTVVKKPRVSALTVTVPPGKGLGWMLSEEADVQRYDQYRAGAAKQLAAARARIADKTRQLARLATSLREWERKAARFAKQASMTDAEIEAQRAVRTAAFHKGRAGKPRRGMNLKEAG